MASVLTSDGLLTAIDSYLEIRVSQGDQQAMLLHTMISPLLGPPVKDASQTKAEEFEGILDDMAEAGAFDAGAQAAIDNHFAISNEPYGIERAREKIVQRLMSAYNGSPTPDYIRNEKQQRQALLAVDTAAKALISGLDNAGTLESDRILRLAYELRLLVAVAVASGDAPRAEAAREEIEIEQKAGEEEYYEVQVEMRSKTTFGTDTETLSVWPGQSAREVAQKAAEGYGATVVEIRYQDGTLCRPEDQLVDLRVKALPLLKKQAGATYTLYQVASKALQGASDDAKAVNWDQVHQEVFDKAVGQDRQPVATVVNAIKLHSPGAVTPEQIEEIDAMMDDKLQSHLLAARARLGGQPKFHSGEFSREISIYSEFEEEQAAYVKMCNATFKIGELLMSQPRGTYLSNAQGGTWLSDAAGELELYMEWGTDPLRDACNVHTATHCDGIDESDLLEITEIIENSLSEPVLAHESERGLLDALVLRDFGQSLKITPPVATQTNDGPGI